MRKCGLSARKAEYIKGIADAAVRGEIDFSRFHEMADEDIIDRLSSLRGIGVWTAKCFCFSPYAGRMSSVGAITP